MSSKLTSSELDGMIYGMFEKFIELVQPHIIPSMQYKIQLRKELNRKTGPKKLA